jgi:hypothetical protein
LEKIGGTGYRRSIFLQGEIMDHPIKVSKDLNTERMQTVKVTWQRLQMKMEFQLETEVDTIYVSPW